MDIGMTAAQLSVGDKASVSRRVTEADLALFAGATGDINPIHFDPIYAKKTFFKGRIAHGILSAGFISSVIANQLPGLGTIYVSQNLRFLAPVRVDDTITAEVEVMDVDAERNRVKLHTRCTNQDGTVVLDGEAVVMPPKRRVVGEDGRALEKRRNLVRDSIANAMYAFTKSLPATTLSLSSQSQPPWTMMEDLWNEHVDHWLNSISGYQEQMEKALDLWLNQTLEAQKEGQRMVLMWVDQLNNNGFECLLKWNKGLTEASRLFQNSA